MMHPKLSFREFNDLGLEKQYIVYDLLYDQMELYSDCIKSILATHPDDLVSPADLQVNIKEFLHKAAMIDAEQGEAS